jgi:transposase
MPELESLKGKQAASLAGRAARAKTIRLMEKPRIHSRRQGFSSKGPYMPALVACRFNKDSRALYQKLVEAAKPAKVAIAAVMRKVRRSRQRPLSQ